MWVPEPSGNGQYSSLEVNSSDRKFSILHIIQSLVKAHFSTALNETCLQQMSLMANPVMKSPTDRLNSMLRAPYFRAHWVIPPMLDTFWILVLARSRRNNQWWKLNRYQLLQKDISNRSNTGSSAEQFIVWTQRKYTSPKVKNLNGPWYQDTMGDGSIMVPNISSNNVWEVLRSD